MWPFFLHSAFAQSTDDDSLLTGVDAHGFHLVAFDADPRDPLTVQRPGSFSGGDWFVSFLGEYATDVIVQERHTIGTVSEVIPDNIAVGNLSLGVALHKTVRVDVVAPFYLLAFGAEGALDGPAPGDIRTSLMISPVRPARTGGFGLALVGQVDAPTGPPERSFGRGALAGGGRIALTYEFPRATLTVDAGAQLNPDVAGLGRGATDTLLAGAAIGLLPARTFGINLEARMSPTWLDVTSGRLGAPPAEALASLRYAAPSGAMWTLGAATALVDGPGVATYRFFIGSGFGKRRTLPTRDVDLLGILKTTDLCPTELETVNGWKDDDGCPDRLGTLQIDVKFEGQSRSADAEIQGESGTQSLRIGPQGLSIDAVPGSAWAVNAKDGCLAGMGEAVASEEGTSLIVEMRPHYDANVAITVIGPENKPVPEALVRWQSDRPECMPLGTEGVDREGTIAQAVGSGAHTLVVTANGFNVIELPITLGVGENRVVNVQLAPSKIVMERREIRILEKVRFESGKAVLAPVSYGLLNEVAAVINSTKGIGRIEVGGHTDNRGGEELNFTLSQDRADAVVEYLVAQGVPRSQLVGRGYGESRPIDTNKTEAGREANRRVEFKLLDAPTESVPATPIPPATVP